ncbi:choline/carnitine O-acyltransferase [Suttonella sp. R2A3]|uniref:choline/carnitine O-acyltransferase n=1 Tax=Suttonella sp. R2A3 TaxID=2908648 RepID=UPI001F2E373F|nr:choline/carnitine O-acyltransferase [Suttonella sp. R2A3]UJF25029.1 choline/carnitine O-acyltransferase [Suttonella sp. R2A3]
MTPLPIPALNDTLERYLRWLKPLVDEKTYKQSVVAVETFKSDAGPRLQEALQHFSAGCAPNSWLIERWRENNLRNRDSLPLSTNVAMEIAWKATQNGLKRAAHFISALVQVHADFQLENIEPSKSPRGEKLCMSQMAILKGASRRPGKDIDRYVFNDSDEPSRHIVVLYLGYAWRVEVLDEQGNVATPAQIDNVIHEILEKHDQQAEIAFTAPSVLPAETATEIRAQLICRDDNSRIWQCVERALFVLSLNNEHFTDADSTIADVIFGDGGNVWAYKPLNYCCYLKDDRYYVHFEHTWNDAAVLEEIIKRAQAHYDAQDCPRKNLLGEHLGMQSLEWSIDEQTRLLLKEALAEYSRRAESLRVWHNELTLNEEDQNLLQDYSLDGICQLILQYAQYATFDRVRSTYEAVDMRHYIQGRTECLRPVSEQSLALVRAMANSKATLAQLEAFNDEHKARIKACKRGEGVHRHLLGLQIMAEQGDEDVAFFKDEGLRLLSEDFLSSSSLGPHHTIGNVAFAPTHAEGLGVNYSANRNHLNFMVIFRRQQGAAVKTFMAELENGLKRLLLLLRS